jgi:hypothetical protein
MYILYIYMFLCCCFFFRLKHRNTCFRSNPSIRVKFSIRASGVSVIKVVEFRQFQIHLCLKAIDIACCHVRRTTSLPIPSVRDFWFFHVWKIYRYHDGSIQMHIPEKKNSKRVAWGLPPPVHIHYTEYCLCHTVNRFMSYGEPFINLLCETFVSILMKILIFYN